MPIVGPVGNSPNSLAILQAMQSLLIAEVLIAGVSPFAALSAADQARYGVARSVFVGRPKDFADAYLPQCNLWIPPADESRQVSELVGYAGRVMTWIEVIGQVFVDMRADWYLGEQKILQIRDALWPVVFKHELLGGTVASVVEAQAEEGRGICYQDVAGTEYRCFEWRWLVRQQWNVALGRGV